MMPTLLILAASTVVISAPASTEPEPYRRFEVAAALTYGMPLAIGTATVVALAPMAGQPNAALAIGVPLQVLMIGSLASGYIYAGEPWRGALVTLGDLGVATAGIAVSGGIAALISGPGQGAGFILPLVGAPIVGGSLVGYNVWKMRDLASIIERKNLGAPAGGGVGNPRPSPRSQP